MRWLSVTSRRMRGVSFARPRSIHRPATHDHLLRGNERTAHEQNCPFGMRFSEMTAGLVAEAGFAVGAATRVRKAPGPPSQSKSAPRPRSVAAQSRCAHL